MDRVTKQEFIEALKSAQANLDNNKKAVNDLNVFPVPDGDTGTNMSLTIQYAVNECTSSKAKTLGEAVSASSNGALMGARGNSGVILSQLFRGFSKAATGLDEFDRKSLAASFRSASNMAYKAVMKPTEGTILTVARIMADKAEELSENSGDMASFLSGIIEAGKIALDNTPNQLDVLKEAGVVDAGGKGLILLLEGALNALEDKPVVFKGESNVSHEPTFFLGEEIPDIMSDIAYGFCTEFLIAVENGNYEKFLIDKLVKLGDSLIVIQDGSIIKVHVHTNEPWTAMKIASWCGEIEKIKIDNMRHQHRELFSQTSPKETSSQNTPDREEESEADQFGDYIIAVSSGAGLSGILKDLGVNKVIQGGQTMNPATEDFLSIIKNTEAERFIILPNNKNIIMTANQAAKMSKKNVSVVESSSIPQAISAMMEFNPDQELDLNLTNMRNALSNVKTAEITYAVRSTMLGGTKIEKGDFIAVVDGEMSIAEKSIEKAVEQVVKKLRSESDLFTLYYGSEVRGEDASKLAETLKKSMPGVEVEMLSGGQPVYYYIISAE